MKTKKAKVWVFTIYKDHIFNTTILGRDFENESMKITPEGVLTVKGSRLSDEGLPMGYSWDGCSPKFEILDIIIGSPDGRIDKITDRPMTYYASMAHDVIYRYGNVNGIKRKEADQLFLLLLGDFKLKYLYYFIVRATGWLFFGK